MKSVPPANSRQDRFDRDSEVFSGGDRSQKVPSIHNHTRSNLFKFLVAGTFALAHTAALQVSSAIAIPAKFTDPSNYPSSWPSTWTPYTINGGALRDDAGDRTTGGTTPNGAGDISPCNAAPAQPASVYFVRDSNNLYFRMCLDGDPYVSQNGPFESATSWSILIDVNGDGFRDFVVNLDGKGGSRDDAPDNLYVLYKNNKRQDFLSSEIDFGDGTAVLWAQDSAKGTNSNTVDGNETGWDVASKDFKRTRITPNSNGTYFLDIQVPLAALDAGGTNKITATSPIALAFATANSNSDSIQKDFTAPGSFKVDPANPIPFGDTVGGNGTTYDQPSIPTITNGGTCAAVSLSARVQDSLKFSGTTFISSVGGVKFYYQRAIGGAIAPNPSGTWTLIGNGTISSTDLGLWTFSSWNTSTLLRGNYFIKAVATDIGADGDSTTAPDNNTTDSIDIVDAVGNNTLTGGDNYNPATNGTTAVYTSVDNTSCGSLGATVSGKVFEDLNYGGGAGRDYNTANNSAISSGWTSGAIGSGSATPTTSTVVELYEDNGAGTVTKIKETTTDDTGSYSFTGLGGGTYRVRVVNNTVRSERTGYTFGTQLPIQTYRHDPDATTPAITIEVGGRVPTGVDVGTQSAGAAFPSTAQSWTDLVVGSTNISNVDFGFNFDTIVNTNNAGQGSLRQFILNSNALTGESNLAQSNQPVGFETSIFMIPNGVANSGQNTNYTNQLTNGIAIINLATGLETISGTKTRLDGSTQTTNVKVTPGGAETNSGQLGTGGKVGVNQIDLPQFNKPEIEIKGKFTLESTGSENQIKSIAFNANRLLVSGSNSLVQDNLVGMEADGDVTASTAGVSNYGIELGAGNNIIVRHNYVKVNQSGIRRDATGTGLLIENNEVDLPTSGQTNTFDGILLIGSGTNDIIRHNLTKNQKGGGIEVGFNGGTLTNTLIENNTVLRNGYDGTSPSTETMGVAAYWLSATSTVTFRRNIITGNSGPGVVVMRAIGVKLEQNSIFANGTTANGTGLSIDLDPNTRDPNSYGTAEGVTPNNGLVSSSLPNQGMDYPIFTKAQRVGNNLKLAGYIGTSLTGNAAFTNATIEIYKADNTDNNQNGEVIAGDTLSKPHGEGRYYIGTIITGANGVFDTTLVIPSSLTDGANTTTLIATDKITAIATNTTNSTSEFSEDIPITPGNPNLLLVKRITGINGSTTTSGADNLAAYKNETSNPYDDNDLTTPAVVPPDTDRWPVSNSLPTIVGGTNGGLIKPNDSIEYTVYFLSAGDSDANNVLFCDRVPANVTFSPNTFTNTSSNPTGAARGIAVKLGSTIDYYTNTADGDIAQYFPPGIEPNTVYPTINCGKDATNQPLPNDNGAVVVKLGNIPNATGTGTPVTSSAYGFVRFQGRVK